MNLKKLVLGGALALSIYQADMVSCDAKIGDIIDDLALPIMSEKVAVRDSFQNPDWESVKVSDSATLELITPLSVIGIDNVKASDSPTTPLLSLLVSSSDKIEASESGTRGLNPLLLSTPKDSVSLSMLVLLELTHLPYLHKIRLRYLTRLLS